MSILRSSRKAIEYLSHVFAHISRWGVFAMMLLIVTDVAMRLFVDRSTLIAEEVGGYLLVLVAYFAMGESLKQDRHIRVDILVERLPGRLQASLNFVLLLMGLVALIVVIWRVIIMVYRSYTGKVTIPGILLTPVYLPQTLIIIGLVALALQCILRLSVTFFNLLEKSDREGVVKMGREVSTK